MNKIIKPVATVMIIVLIMALIWIFLTYYKNNEDIDTIVYPSGNSNVSSLNIPNDDYINDKNSTETLSGNQGLIESIINNTSSKENENSGDSVVDVNINNDEKTDSPKNQLNSSGDNININSGDTINNSGEVIVSEKEDTKNNNQEVDIVIVSDPQTSNQEKQEVLTEIDKALQGLLEAVGKVETVDETRLDATLDSEVDKP